MLDKPTKDMEPAPGWRFLQFLGFGHSRGPHDVPRLLDAFLAAYPDISFTLKQGGVPAMLDQLRAGALDVVVVAPMPPADDRLESLVLAEERLCLTVASDHRLAHRASAGPRGFGFARGPSRRAVRGRLPRSRAKLL